MRIAILAMIACGVTAQVRNVDPPALANSGMPFLTEGPAGSVYLSWIDPLEEKEHALRFSRWRGSTWSEPETIARGRNWFVNWGDFPSLSVLPDGSMLAHWLTRSEGAGTYGYGIRVAKREPSAPGWRQIHGMSLDEKVDYAGFLTFVPGRNAAIYLSPPFSRVMTANRPPALHPIITTVTKRVIARRCALSRSALTAAWNRTRNWTRMPARVARPQLDRQKVVWWPRFATTGPAKFVIFR